MPARGFLDGATLSRNGLLLGLPLLSRPRFHGARQMRNLWAPGADFFLLRVGVRLHAFKTTEIESVLPVNFGAPCSSKFLDVGTGFSSLSNAR